MLWLLDVVISLCKHACMSRLYVSCTGQKRRSRSRDDMGLAISSDPCLDMNRLLSSTGQLENSAESGSLHSSNFLYKQVRIGLDEGHSASENLVGGALGEENRSRVGEGLITAKVIIRRSIRSSSSQAGSRGVCVKVLVKSCGLSVLRGPLLSG